ncbi:MAG: hypothetical protein CBC64_005905 [Gammaproteobacteria bacterium TMED104]|nr:MAG: hypothetical protein CBC64_005905 [Gammaproteobacteria bacterium TMED104]|tara:strand:+ start:6892 stop:7299 length:408 start_codon:yes stop_codon:yes gene_type:complete
MADTVTSQTIQDGERVAIIKFTNVSDGTGESAVKKVDVSALASSSQGKACTSVKVAKIWWACRGMGVNIEFDASTNVLITGLPSDSTGDEYYSDVFTGIPNNAGSGKTGDIDFTTVGHSSGDTYSIILELVKDYE